MKKIKEDQDAKVRRLKKKVATAQKTSIEEFKSYDDFQEATNL